MERKKLARERIMLLMADMTLQFGPPQAVLGSHNLQAHIDGTCIRCGLPFKQGDSIRQATWPEYQMNGFYVHDFPSCPHMRDHSPWLLDDALTIVFDRVVMLGQKCKWCNRKNATARAIKTDTEAIHLEYICDDCVEAGGE